jgi:hypothetical protein
MVFSLLTSNDGVSLKTTPFRIYSQNGVLRRKFHGSFLAETAAILSVHEVGRPDNGSVNVATNSPCGRFGRYRRLRYFLVADEACGGRGEFVTRLSA